jgi:hypothetical protein
MCTPVLAEDVHPFGNPLNSAVPGTSHSLQTRCKGWTMHSPPWAQQGPCPPPP